MFPFALRCPGIVCMRQPLKLDLLWAGFRMPGAVYFMFRA
jgi:uncharacterized protein (DUF486 family)